MMRVFLTPFAMIYLNQIGIGTPRMIMIMMAILSINCYLYKTSGLMRKVVVIAGMN